jgi:uncharacterized tellurite resistance protein B-like protein
MILIGTMNLTRTRDRGNFHCPTCGVTETYRLRARRPFLTLYFIPTVPVGAAELFVQCDQCRSTWDPSVLDMDEKAHREAREQQFADEVIRAAVLVVIADGTISEAEITALQRLTKQTLERELDREELGRICSVAEQNRITATNYVLTVSRHWSKPQRVRALQAMFLAATADDGLGTTQLQILKDMRDLLKLTDREYQEAIEAVIAVG